MRIIKKLFLAIAVISIATQIYAKDESFKPIKFTKETLDNGLQVIYTIDKSAPVVATVVHYRVGSRYEIPGKTGYAHFFEHLMFEATNAYPRATIDKYVEEAGGNMNAHTSNDETVFYIKLPSNQLQLALWIESQRMRGLHVDSIGVETQRGVVTEEMKMRRENSAYGTFFDKMSAYLFKGGNYEWTTIGAYEDIQNAKISDFRDFYDTYYYPNNATLVIAGDFNLDQARLWVKEYFGKLPSKPIPPEKPMTIQPLTQTIVDTVYDDKAQLPALFIGYQGISQLDSNYYALSLLTTILAQGESSRMYQDLVDKKRISVEAVVFPLSFEKAGGIVFIDIIAPGKTIDENIKEIDNLIKQVAKEGVTAGELQKAKNIMEASFVGDKKNVLPKAMSLASYNSYYQDPSMINTELEKYMKVTQEDLKRVANLYLTTDKRVILIYLPKQGS
ncbi:MAG TPA: pitrilysin family protein [Bacteroidota bacterium]|nr:pitrilysin family protein [Candidatus Kapabacteria bacterium]HRS01801.1 pitrilysin family protein [Bacteroidota bacterium]